MDDRELDLDALEKMALAATPGPWRTLSDGKPGLRNVAHMVEARCGAMLIYDQIMPNDAAFVAAFDPPTVLKLIALARPKAGGVEARDIVQALVLELHCCAQQLAARGLKGREGDSVSRALANGRAYLAAAPEPLRVAEPVSNPYKLARQVREGLAGEPCIYETEVAAQIMALPKAYQDAIRFVSSDEFGALIEPSDAQSVRPDGGEG